MALFSRLRGGSSQDTSIARAVLAPAVLTMAADGRIDDAEVIQLTNMLTFSPIFLPLGGKATGELIKTVLKDLQKSGPDKVITESAQLLSPALRETAFCFAMRVAMADGVLEESEKNVLSGTASRLQLSDQAFESIVHVVTMMQRSAAA
ncbi:tellurite resistance TerB family protein [Ruegeria sp. R14_0]|uniref:tellurite resistance TerB family protein n=1 Tax=Ruegeria sp. R14_0 TaxID=2821100 RepID=UPI001ADA50E2|nr:tellurite resistance TerB family protein [Ruegeria sp. R14_0]MBO9445161.1 tellurite resistance TerB family protein [Ruegeria sp. R14_0]